MKKFACLLLSFLLVFTISISPVSASETQSENLLGQDIYIEIPELPENGEPIQYVYNLPPVEGVNARASSYIVFWITRTGVVWNVVNLPSSYIFNGYMNIMNITTGLSAGQYMSMYGRNGACYYTGSPGHTFRLFFDGKIMNGSKVVSQESSMHLWQVPH